MNPLPPSLDRFEHELGAAIGRRSHRRPVRLAVRTAIATAAVAAIALGTLSVVSGHDPSAVARAAAVLTPPGGSIMHVVLVTTDTTSDGKTSSVRSESWERVGPDNAVREIRTLAGRSYEIATVGGETQLYDPAANTIYVSGAGSLKEAELQAAKHVQARQAPAMDAVKAAKAAAEGTPNRGAAVTDRFSTKIAALLGDGRAHEDGHVTFDGRDAIRIVAPEGMSLLVDASTYEPIEWRNTQDGLVRVTHFSTFERIAASDSVLSLTAQHPGATVDRDADHFTAAVRRLTPENDNLRIQEGTKHKS